MARNITFAGGASDFSGLTPDTLANLNVAVSDATLYDEVTGAVTLANDTGIGVVVYYGTGTTVAGYCYRLHTDGSWDATDADAEASSVGLLALALGTAPGTHGMLPRGHFDLTSALDGAYSVGAALYLHTDAGELSFTQPSGSGDIVRVVGYGATAANVVWFDPDSVWTEVA